MPNVRLTDWIAMPGKRSSRMAEMPPKRQAFQQRIGGRGHRGPFLLEDGDHCADKSADAPDPQIGKHSGSANVPG